MGGALNISSKFNRFTSCPQISLLLKCTMLENIFLSSSLLMLCLRGTRAPPLLGSPLSSNKSVDPISSNSVKVISITSQTLLRSIKCDYSRITKQQSRDVTLSSSNLVVFPYFNNIFISPTWENDICFSGDSYGVLVIYCVWCQPRGRLKICGARVMSVI